MIPITERLPAPGLEVLVYVARLDNSDKYFAIDQRTMFPDGVAFFTDKTKISTVTHWCALPDMDLVYDTTNEEREGFYNTMLGNLDITSGHSNVRLTEKEPEIQII